MNRESNSSVGITIFLASLILVAINTKADDKVPQNQNLKLVWASDCPKYQGSSNTNLCKKKIYADESIDISKLKWEEVEDIAKISYDWKYRIKMKFNNKK